MSRELFSCFRSGIPKRDLAPLSLTWEVGSVRQCSAQTVVVPALFRLVNDSQAWALSEKVILSIWLSSKGMLLFDRLPPNITITGQLYFQQLDLLTVQARQKRPNHSPIRFLQDKARPHVAKIACQKLLKPGKCPPTHCTTSTLCTLSFICSCPLAAPWNSRHFLKTMTWISG